MCLAIKFEDLWSLVLTGGLALAAAAAEPDKLINGVPNYDQDLFPIDRPYGTVSGGGERGDCTPVACTMIHGYYDSHRWPRLIPYGGPDIVPPTRDGAPHGPRNVPSQPYAGNAWGIDTVVQSYKARLGYTPNQGTPWIPLWDILFNRQASAIRSVVREFDAQSEFTAQDSHLTRWDDIKTSLDRNEPFVLSVLPAVSEFAVQIVTVSSVAELADQGRLLIVVATIQGQLHFRIFDQREVRVRDVSESSIPSEKTALLNQLKADLVQVAQDNVLSQPEASRIASLVTTLLDATSGGYRWEGEELVNLLGGGHSVTATGWAEDSGKWVIANMGWHLAKDAWFNRDMRDDWYISYVQPGGVSSPDDDDVGQDRFGRIWEDNDTIEDAIEIKRGEVYENLRCRDTVIVSEGFEKSYGDWYLVRAILDKPLAVTIRFANAAGNLDLRMFDEQRQPVGESCSEADVERVGVPTAQSSVYYIFVYGHAGDQNERYSIEVDRLPLRVSPALPSYVREYGFAPAEYPVKYEASDFLPGDGPEKLKVAPRVLDPGRCQAVGDYVLRPGGGSDSVYEFAPSDAHLKVIRRPLSIRAADAIRTEGNPNPAFKAEFVGLEAGCDTAAGFEVSFETPAESGSPPGQYEVLPRVAGRVAQNYDITIKPGVLTVDPVRERLAWLTESASAFPRAAVDSDGFVHVVFAEVGRVLYRKAKPTGELISSIIEVFPHGHSPDIAVGEDGRIDVVALTTDLQSVLHARLDTTGNVIRRRSFGPTSAPGLYYLLSSPRVALDESRGLATAVVGVIQSTHQWVDFTFEPPPFPGPTLGEIFNYIAILGIRATLAIPRVRPGGEGVIYYEVDGAGEEVSRGTVYHKWADAPYPETVQRLSVAVDDGGTPHFVWRESSGGQSAILWKTGRGTYETPPERLAQEAGERGSLGPPEVAAKGGAVAVAWARRGYLDLVEVRPRSRVAVVRADVNLAQPIGLAPAGSAWRVAWVDEPMSRLSDVVVGWAGAGTQAESDTKLRVSVSTEMAVGQASRVLMPSLASRNGVWALVFAAGRRSDENHAHVAIYTQPPEGSVLGLVPGSELWDRRDFSRDGAHTSVQVNCVRGLLAHQEGATHPVEGVVADGVTPLLFRFSGVQAGKVRLAVRSEQPGAVAAVAMLHEKLAVASDFDEAGHGTWRPGLVQPFDPGTQDEDLHVKLDGLSLEALGARDVVWPAPGRPQELPFVLELWRNRAGEPREDDLMASTPFAIRKPPVVLVHGYNSNAGGWSPEFTNILAQVAGPDGVVAINYGTDYMPDDPAQVPGNYRNTREDLETLRGRLSVELEKQEDYFRRKWAMSRYDVVGHSQGGVLLRMLCADEFDSAEGFVNARNFGRGRFRRVVTVGSPHNGSRLAHYLSTLKAEISSRPDVGEWGVGADQLFWLMDRKAPNVFQDKFDPFLLSAGFIRTVNDTLPTHAAAPFHVISSVIDHQRWVLPAGVFWLFGLTNDERLEIVVPQGAALGGVVQRSDGVVDFRSHFGGVTNPQQRSEVIETVAHAEARLYGAEHTQQDSPAIAALIAHLLYDLGSAARFGPFANPSGLGDDVRTEIDALAARVSIEAAERAREVELTVLPWEVRAALESLRLLVRVVRETGDPPPPRPPPASEPFVLEDTLWTLKVYSPDPAAETGVTWERSAAISGEIEVSIPLGLRAQVVAFVAAPSGTGGMLTSRPTLLYDTLSEHIRGLAIVGVDATLARKEQRRANVVARLDDGGVSAFFLDRPQALRWRSSNPEVLSVAPGGLVVTGDLTGVAVLTAEYGEWSGQWTVQVVDRMPEVAVLQPHDGSRLSTGETATVEAVASDPDGTVNRVVLYLNEETIHEWTEPPFTWTWARLRPGDHRLRAAAYDDAGGVRVSSPVQVTVVPEPPACAWDAPAEDAWCSGVVRLLATVADPDVDDTVTVEFEYSVNSSDGVDGEWQRCAGPVTAPPYAAWWRSQPPEGLDDQVWLRMRATDGFGLSSPYATRRIRVDNTVFGGVVINGQPAVSFDPHPGEENVALDRTVFVRFALRPLSAEGSALSDGALAVLVSVKDGAGEVVSAVKQVLDEGRTVRVQPSAPFLPRRLCTIHLVTSVRVGEVLVPPVASAFRTIYGPPARLRVSGWPAFPRAGEGWEPPLEVLMADALGNRVENGTGTITLTLRSADGRTLGTYESVAQLGVARFRAVRCEEAGSVRLQMACRDPLLVGEEAMAVLPGALGSFRVEAPSELEAGQPMSVVVTAYDGFGNVKTDYLGVPRLSSGDGRAEFEALPAFRPSDQGRRLYSGVGTLRSLGPQWVQVHSAEAVSSRVPVQVLNAAPRRPAAVSPARMAVAGRAPRLEATPFVDVDDAAQGASQWQVGTNAAFEPVVWDATVETGGNRVGVPAGVLEAGTSYYWRVRYRDAPPNDDAPRWSEWSLAAGFRTAQGFPWADDFAVDRGWKASPGGLWSRVAASGLGAGSPSDDTSPGEDGQILTTALNGGPPSDLAGAWRIVSPAVDCSGQRVVELSYWRWLEVDSSDWAGAEVAVSVDGETWVPVWQNTLEGVRDRGWVWQRHDLTEIAAGQPTVYVSVAVGPQVDAVSLPGWHIDDVRLDQGLADQVVATLSLAPTNVVQGDVLEARILVREQVEEAPGFLGGSFDLVYDASGLELISPSSAPQVVSAPFSEVMAEGVFTPGRITGLGGATLTQGHGSGEDVVFAVLRFRAVRPGAFGMSLAAGDAGCVLAQPVGLVGKARVRCGEPMTIQVQPPPVIPLLELRLEGPPDPVITGDTFELRLAVRENHPLARGFLGGAVDLYFDESLVEPVAPLNLPVIVDAAFQTLGILSGAIAESRIDELGGVTLTEGLADGNFVTYLRVPFRAHRPGNPVFTVGPSQAGLVLASPVGQLASQEVDWGSGLSVPVFDWPIAQASPANPGWLNRGTLDLTVGGAGIVEYRYSLDGAGWSAVFPTNQPIQLRSLAEGAHELRVLGRNDRGAWQDANAATTVRWSVDTVAPSPPTLLAADPAAGEWSSQPTTSLHWTASTDQHSGLQGYRLAWAGTPVPPAMEGDLVSALPSSREFQESGEQWLHIIAVDLVGNAGAVTTLGPFRFDRDPPQIELPAQVQASGETRIPLGAVEPHSGVASAIWSVVGGPAQEIVLSEPGPAGVTVRASANSSYTLQVVVTDRAGNQASRTMEFVFVRRPPRVVNMEIAAGEPTTAESTVPVTVLLDRGDAARVEALVQVNGEAADWILLEGPSNSPTLTVNLGRDDGRKEVCVLLRDADYPTGAYTSQPGCGVIWLDRLAWSFIIQAAGAINPDVRFGESLRATDGFDDGLDVRATIADPWENQVRLSQLQGGASVYADFKQTRPDQQWLLVVAGGASSIGLSWTPASVPGWVTLEIVPARRLDNQWVPNGEAISLRAVAGISAGPGSVYFLLRKSEAPTETNTAPTVTTPPAQTVAELANLALTLTATDADQPAQTLTFSLVNPPGGATIDASTGVFNWTPTEAQGPGTYTITVVAKDNGSPALSGTNTFQVNVTEVNTAPTVAAPPAQTVAELATLALTLTATDADLPAQTLTFSLIDPPAGVRLDPATGFLTWTPAVGQGGSNYVLLVLVSDQGVPPLFATNAVNVRVNALGGTTQPAVLMPISADGSGFRLQITGQPGGRYTIEASADLAQWTVIGNVTLGDGLTATFLDSRAIDGGKQFYRAVAAGGSVAPASALAVAGFDANGFRFTLTGQPRARYTIEFSTDMVHWSDRDTITLGDGPTASFSDAMAAGGRTGFYRVRSY